MEVQVYSPTTVSFSLAKEPYLLNATYLFINTCHAGDESDVGSIPGSGRSPGVGNGNPLQYSCWGNPMDRRAWQATIHGVTKSRTQLSD